jgi:hypothetical protein
VDGEVGGSAGKRARGMEERLRGRAEIKLRPLRCAQDDNFRPAYPLTRLPAYPLTRSPAHRPLPRRIQLIAHSIP